MINLIKAIKSRIEKRNKKKSLQHGIEFSLKKIETTKELLKAETSSNETKTVNVLALEATLELWEFNLAYLHKIIKSL